MKGENYYDRKRLINKYEMLDIELKKRLKEAVKYTKTSINPVRLYYQVVYHLDTDEAISKIYGLSICEVKEIRSTKAK